MSNGNQIAYHLRPNKTVDRNLFVDLLNKINNYKNISDYIYVGFGGPFLEDFKVMHTILKIKKMISLEIIENTHKRQKFNMPISCIDIGDGPHTAQDFLTNYHFKKRSRHIVWLDYTLPSEINQQLGEIELLCNNLNPYDIIKVTLNAHAETLGRDNSLPYSASPHAFRANALQDILDVYAPHPIQEKHVTTKAYPTTLLHALDKAMHMGIRTRPDISIQPLSSFIYADGQTMLTATAIILENNHSKVERFFKGSRLNNWPFLNKLWDKPKDISIPVMSLKERLEIEAKLPNSTPEEIIDSMGFFLADSEPHTIKQLRTFIEYQRAIPWFSKVQL
ncbi:O-methyltransferase [Pseudescherichia sp.]|uniref:O-methyltransferase n=1 Tax=Pseudescherichia sp. TaxID=2055881 RepID=UPI0028B0B630|nr:O-methyltransferase [Pseudescherichia sp.]